MMLEPKCEFLGHYIRPIVQRQNTATIHWELVRFSYVTDTRTYWTIWDATVREIDLFNAFIYAFP